MQPMPTTAKETAGKLGVPYRNEQQLFDPAMNIRLWQRLSQAPAGCVA